jgi:hypothetical protein
MSSNGLAEFIPAFGAGGYVEARPNLLTDARFCWIWRRQRARIVAAGAGIIIAGRLFVNPEKMDALLFELGREAAERRLGADDVPAEPAAGAPTDSDGLA